MSHRARRAIAATLIACVLIQTSAGAVDSDGAAYVGGTADQYSAAKQPINGVLNTTDPEWFVFYADDKPFTSVTLPIIYKQITELEYGQKAGRRVGVAVATGLLLTPFGLLALLSKKRSHFLTITFKDDAGADQVAVLEIGKDIVRTTLAIIQTRSGQKVIYQDEEARKHGTGG
jgi:hypothetical protein